MTVYPGRRLLSAATLPPLHWNLYNYAKQSPTNFVDPNGENWLSDSLKVIGKSIDSIGAVLTCVGLGQEAVGGSTMAGGMVLTATGVGAPAGGAAVAGGATLEVTGWATAGTGGIMIVVGKGITGLGTYMESRQQFPEDCWHPGSYGSPAANLNKHYGKYADKLSAKLGKLIGNRKEYTEEALKFLQKNINNMKPTTIGKIKSRNPITGEVIRREPGFKSVDDNNIFGIFNEALDKIVNFGTEP